VRFLRERGYERIVLCGNSGGGSLAASIILMASIGASAQPAATCIMCATEPCVIPHSDFHSAYARASYRQKANLRSNVCSAGREDFPGSIPAAMANADSAPSHHDRFREPALAFTAPSADP
jgi:hypothetical protein